LNANKPKNVIVLTTGLSGSSVLSGVVSESGYWAGNDTVIKDNFSGQYDTYENAELVELNDRLCDIADFLFDDITWYKTNGQQVFEEISDTTETASFREFLSSCKSHQPWIWKDPKVWLTIGFWKNFIDPKSTRIILLRRNGFNLWLSQVVKRIIYDYFYLDRSEKTATAELIKYLNENNLEFIQVKFESLVSDTELELKKINQFLGSNIKLEHWEKIYQKPKFLSSVKRLFLGLLIYMKNYQTRIH
jgi:hypothetical protein